MSNETGLEKTYKHHHTKGSRRGHSMFKDIRGEFLRDRIKTGKKVLDIGCRDGVLTKEYAEGNTVLGVDIDQEALDDLAERLSIETRKIDLHADWNIPKNSFDVVVAGEVLEHLYYPDIVVSKISDVLKDGGMLIGSVPNAFSLINRLRLLIGKKKGTPLCDPTHINHFSRKELKTVLIKNFKNVKITPLGNYAFLDRFFPGYFSFMLLFEATKKDK
ncbi:MAG: 2-polyprenyl-3-methyl-5-hydroxy-6-metoxy-1,4-benzoquinol methylase [Candidatus Paceibacteria bacterium]|jgi:2-polyprenyl-3-methyl-5-hydroxy-6-metoxy-1,4-benzoquinol methylase